ncbi:MBL fold metallo-hydrolase [Fictibacillus nanhaiensis]|uniref:MBL fold metallo-hydrolase n=1 Tax=Fictibacillus nanhaiensis TaxID=742169 RepID=A0ABS2ZST8_9BACL|nr:MBL fold metallo-hydrolase [Fictibacillus nanhaiensis]
MQNYICETCGVQYEGSVHEPHSCMICEEERQYVSSKGQSWTTLEAMVESGNYKTEVSVEEENLYRVQTSPSFGIGQTAYLVKGNGYNMLWDCVSYIDEDTIKEIRQLGGIDAIALSHPHYYSTQVEWAETFDAPLYIHEDDKMWVTRTSDKIVFWSGDKLELSEGIILHRIGGHFKGGTILEWKQGNHHQGVLLCGDIVRIVADREWVSFMYSYPNFIPLPSATVERIAHQMKELTFTRIYDAFNRVIKEDAGEAVQRSAKRYVDALNGVLFHT